MDIWNPNKDYKIVYTSATQRDMAKCDMWHSYFLWTPKGKLNFYKITPNIKEGIPGWATTVPANEYFYDLWAQGLDSLSDDLLNRDYLSVSLKYERASNMPCVRELTALQEECEKEIDRLGDYYYDLKEAERATKSLFSAKRKKSQEKIEELEPLIAESKQRIMQMLHRVDEIRAIVLGG